MRVSLSTRLTPTSAARSSVRFWLQAITSIPNARPTLATALPSFPRPSTPSVLPPRSPFNVVCHRPAFIPRSWAGIWQARPSRMAHANSAVGWPAAPVPQTVTPCAFAASISKDRFRMPVVTSNFSFGRRFRRSAGKGVRSRMPTTISKSESFSVASSWSANG